MQIIVAEKPKVAYKIANALGKPKRAKLGNVYYYIVGDNYVLPAVGHVFGLAEKKKTYSYPTFDYVWKPYYEISKKYSYVKQYIELMKYLKNKADSVIVACDFDIEGTLIGYNVARFIFSDLPVYRMKFSTLTKTELINAYDHYQDFDIYNAYAGETRHVLDWLYGINLSRALMSSIRKAGMKRIMSIGRVQGPTLHLAYTREMEIKAFKPEEFFKLYIWLKGFQFEYIEKIFDKDEAIKKYKQIGNDANIISIVENKFNIYPPVPFDLTTLQLEASSKLNLTPKQTLMLAQNLYEKSLISYPRTSSQKLPPSIGYKSILNKLKNISTFSKYVNQLDFNHLKPMQGKKEDPAHPAIYPTGLTANMTKDEEKLYKLIVFRFIALFGPKAEKITTTVRAKTNDLEFIGKGARITKKGWITLYPYYVSNDKEIPLFEKNEIVEVDKKQKKKDQTKPKPRYSEATLISELEKRNLGTKATRALIVGTLLDRHYLEKEKKRLFVTEYGVSVDEVLSKYVPEILDEQLTRQFELNMDKISKGKLDKEIVIEQGKETLKEILSKFKEKEYEIGKQLLNALNTTESNVIGKCVCGGDLRILYNKKSKTYFVGCSNYPKCTITYSLPKGYEVKPANKLCPYCNVPMVKIRKKYKRWFDICINPECPSKNQNSR